MTIKGNGLFFSLLRGAQKKGMLLLLEPMARREAAARIESRKTRLIEIHEIFIRKLEARQSSGASAA